MLAKALASEPTERFDSVQTFTAALDEAVAGRRQGIPRWAMGAAAGLILAAPYGAVLSTVSGWLLIVSSGLVRDLYQRDPRWTVPPVITSFSPQGPRKVDLAAELGLSQTA